ncbi:EAL domain-containing protein [Lacticaseibacillus jixiensis]|uniref:EAL domain-containing protein n=1 Tax=Lacticaseibacillus jixiensis TaxID=3231926 RepID=UPI0036F36A4F
MRRFIGQPKFRGDGSRQQIGYELFVREYEAGQWRLPEDFNAITAIDIRRMLSEALLHMDNHIQLLSFNLEQRQFIDADFANAAHLVQQRTPIELVVELTERKDPAVNLAQLRAGAKRFKAAGIAVCIDDVGTEGNDADLVAALDPYINEYKFAFQNLRPFNDLSDVVAVLEPWYRKAAKCGKHFAIEGIETASGLARLTREYPADIYQGYLLGKPGLLPKGNELHWNI